MKIRTVTVFGTVNTSSDILPLISFAKRAKEFLANKNFEVQTVRVAIKLPSLDLVPDLNTLCQEHDHHFCSIGQVDLENADRIPQLLIDNPNVSCSLDILKSNDNLEAAARTIVAIGQKNADANFRFTASTNIAPFTPFFPASYVTDSIPSFSIGLQAVAEITDAIQQDQTLTKLRESLADIYSSVENEAKTFSSESKLYFAGIDTSTAPLGEESVADAIESISMVPLGEKGTQDACRTLTSILKSIPVHRVGYCGLMLPVLEDAGIGRRNDEGLLTIDKILEYSSVCGTGLDTVPIPGDITVLQVTNILRRVAELSQKLNKPLSARLFPTPGKKVGETTVFSSPYLFNTKVMDPLS
jgi:uncharacterized protein